MSLELELCAGRELRRIAQGEVHPSVAIRAQHFDESVPELKAMRGVPQDARWHPEGDVFTHSLLAADAAAQVWDAKGLGELRRDVVVLAALFHDAGKPRTTLVHPDRVTSPEHAEAGAQLIETMGVRLAWPGPFVRSVAELVREHMVPLSVRGAPSLRAVRRLVTRLEMAETNLTEWAVVVEADGRARGSGSTVGRSEAWLRVFQQSRA